MTDRQTYVTLAGIAVCAFLFGLMVQKTFFNTPKINACVVKVMNGALYVPGCEFIPIPSGKSEGAAA